MLHFSIGLITDEEEIPLKEVEVNLKTATQPKRFRNRNGTGMRSGQDSKENGAKRQNIDRAHTAEKRKMGRSDTSPPPSRIDSVTSLRLLKKECTPKSDGVIQRLAVKAARVVIQSFGVHREYKRINALRNGFYIKL